MRREVPTGRGQAYHIGDKASAREGGRPERTFWVCAGQSHSCTVLSKPLSVFQSDMPDPTRYPRCSFIISTPCLAPGDVPEFRSALDNPAHRIQTMTPGGLGACTACEHPFIRGAPVMGAISGSILVSWHMVSERGRDGCLRACVCLLVGRIAVSSRWRDLGFPRPNALG